MATVLHLDDLLSVRLEFEDLGGHKAFNMLHYRLNDVSVAGGGLWAGDNMYDIAPIINLEMWDWFAEAWALTASNQVKMTGISIQNIFPLPTSRQYHYSPPGGSISGTLLSEALPLQDCVTILKRSDGGSRRDMGRVFVTGCPEVGQEGGALTAVQRGKYDIFATAFDQIITFTNGIYTYNFYPVLVAKGEAGVLGWRNVFDSDVSDNVLKTQRRRRPGKGI